MSNLISSNPNATVSAIGTAAAALVLYLLDRFAGIQVNAYYATLIAGAVSSGLLFLGRDGLGGVINLILHGRGTTSPPSETPPTK